MQLRFLVAAGGTGGHIFPALAVADALKRLHADTLVEFVGTKGKMEDRVLPRAGYRVNHLWISGLERKLSLATALLPLKLSVAMAQAWRLIGRVRPHAVICAGAYVSLPIGLAASMRGVPLVLMESNAYPGLAIRKLAPRAAQIHVAFEEAARHFAGLPAIVSGNPIRKVLAEPIERDRARRHFGLDPARPTLFAFGGSLGARSINGALDAMLEELRADGLQLIWQTGTSYEGGERREEWLYRTTFLNEMELGYAAADLVLARAGATTIAELKGVARASILVPLPIASVRQLDNAEAMVAAGASVMIPDDRLREELLPTIRGLMTDPERLRRLGEAAGTMAAVDADERIARAILELVDRPSR